MWIKEGGGTWRQYRNNRMCKERFAPCYTGNAHDINIKSKKCTRHEITKGDTVQKREMERVIERERARAREAKPNQNGPVRELNQQQHIELY